SLARRELEGPPLDEPVCPEVLEENRFLAARDGLDATLLDPRRRRRVALRELVQELIEECLPHAVALGCGVQLVQVNRLAAVNGAERQRIWATQRGVAHVLTKLADQFA